MVVVEGMNSKGVEGIFLGGEGLVRNDKREESGKWKIRISSCMFVPIANMQVLLNGGESPGSVKGNNIVASSMRCGGRDALLLGSYKPCHRHVPYTHKVFSKVESRSKLTNHLETCPV